MKEQLIQYVDLLFAGAADSEEIKQEILHNTLDRYDDLIDQGKSPEAAYRLAITGIGDISEILSAAPGTTAPTVDQKSQAPSGDPRKDRQRRRPIAAAVAFYILCPFPLIVLSEFGYEMIGLVLMFLMIAAATALLIMNSKEQAAHEKSADTTTTDPRQELRKSISSAIWAVGLGAYFLISYLTQAWYITWLIFPLIGSVQGLFRAILDLKEANANEN